MLPISSLIIKLISYATALLFVYTAVSKLFEFENFQVQLGQSPLLSAFAAYISVGVPIIELLLALGLTLPRYRESALKGSFILMVLFTTYIYVILNYSAYVPCSCGGAIEKMTWNEHLFFNGVYLLLLVLALFLTPIVSTASLQKGHKNVFLWRSSWILASTCAGVVSVVLLFQWSENLVQYSNTLTRRMPPHAAQLQKQFDLKVNSYYFAGAYKDKIYLGNRTAPLLVTEIDTTLKSIKTHKIVPNDKTLPFRTPQICTKEDYFFLFEGNVPYVFRGSTEDWKAELLLNDGSYFSQLEPIHQHQVGVRFIAKTTGHSLLGSINLTSHQEHVAEALLVKQLDGIFDVDGSLHFDTQTKSLVYVYRYRNEFVVAKEDLSLHYRGTTIDTISKVQIGLQEVKSKQIKTFSVPPLVVNKMSAVDDGLLFVNSAIPGKFESKTLWKQASIIDVYDLKNNSYQASFPIYKIGKDQMQSFIVLGDKVYVIIHNQLVYYRLYNHLLAKTNYHKKRD